MAVSLVSRSTGGGGKAAPNKQPSSIVPAVVSSAKNPAKPFSKSHYSDEDWAEFKKNIANSQDKYSTAYQTALTMAQMHGAGTEEELDEYGDQALKELFTNDGVLGSDYLSMSDIRRSRRNPLFQVLDAANEGIRGFNTGLGGVVDAIGDETIGNLVGLFGGQEAGQQFKDFATAEDVGGVLSAAEDFGLWFINPAIAAGKAAIENSDNLERALTGVDPLTLQQIDAGQRATSGGAAAVDIALSSLPGLGVGKAAVKQASKVATREAAKATDELTRITKELGGIETMTDDQIIALAKKYKNIDPKSPINIPEKLTMENRSQLVADIQRAADTKVKQEISDFGITQGRKAKQLSNLKNQEGNVNEIRQEIGDTLNFSDVMKENARREGRFISGKNRKGVDTKVPVIGTPASDLAVASAPKLNAQEAKSLADTNKALFDEALENNTGLFSGILDLIAPRVGTTAATGGTSIREAERIARDYMRRPGINGSRKIRGTDIEIPSGAANPIARGFQRMRGGTAAELNQEAAEAMIKGKTKEAKALKEQAEKLAKKDAKKNEAKIKELNERAAKIEDTYTVEKALDALQKTNPLIRPVRRARAFANADGKSLRGRFMGDLGGALGRGAVGYLDQALQMAADMGTDPSTALQDYAALTMQGGASPALLLSLLAPGPKRWSNNLLGTVGRRGKQYALPYNMARLNIMNSMQSANPSISSAIPSQELAAWMKNPVAMAPVQEEESE